MRMLAGLRDTFTRLSSRERLLLGAAAAIAFAMSAIYGVRLPGEAAALSAANRNARAAADLAETRMLAADAASVHASGEMRLEQLKGLASAQGINVVDARAVDGELTLSMRSQTSSDVVAWAALASEQAAPLRSLSITRQATDLAVEASFPESGQ